jgi:acyl-CoA synthetase (NDP forming)
MAKAKLLEHEAFELLKSYGVPHPPFGLAKTPDEAGELADKIGYPVVLKVVSPDISHKFDVGGVVLGVESRVEAVRGFETITRNIERNAPGARIIGVLVQKMLKPGVEVIIGGLRDPTFGIVLMLGLGGVFTEVFRDVSFRVSPLRKSDVYEMIEELRSTPLLKGFRGLPPVDLESIVDIVLKLEKIMKDHEEIESADLNPVFAYPNGAVVVDARFILKGDNPSK